VEAASLGIDDRASTLLEKLPEHIQQAILAKAQEGQSEGKVRNISAWVASACMNAEPEALGLDEKASELMKQLPRERRQEILEKLKRTEGVNNPSAWVAKACLKETRAAAATVVYAAPQAYGKGGYYLAPPAYGKGGYGKGGPVPVVYVPIDNGARSYASTGKGRGKPQLDSEASALLGQLPQAEQHDILEKLRSSSVRNPSAWVVKAALQAGATPAGDGGRQHRVAPGLDEQASALLGQLPHAEQQNILEKLRSSSVRNPSAWVVKAALQAGATPVGDQGMSAQSGNGKGKGVGRYSPY